MFPILTPPLSLKGLGTKLNILRCSLEDEFHHQEVVSTVTGVELPNGQLSSTVYISKFQSFIDKAQVSTVTYKHTNY